MRESAMPLYRCIPRRCAALVVLCLCGTVQAQGVSVRERVREVQDARRSAPIEPGESIHGDVYVEPPGRISGRAPVLTPEAIEAGVKGVAIYRCHIPVSGILERCRAIKTLPHMDQELRAALATWRMRPAKANGEPVAIDYVFDLRIGAAKPMADAGVSSSP